MTLHLHLDLVGGIAGDMFAGAMLSAFPDLAEPLKQDLSDAGLDPHVAIDWAPTNVNGLAATAFSVQPVSDERRATGHYSDIRARLQASALDRDVLMGTLAIFDILADAESQVHQVAVEKVHFHEIADWDSVADIVAAASLITRSQASSFSCGTVPAGSGRVQTEHGEMPIPAPATTIILRGFSLVDDGRPGERVTPTGAAILRHCIADPASLRPAGRLLADGSGCGGRRYPDLPNIVRVLAMDISALPEPMADAQSTSGERSLLSSDRVGVLAFEIDDMTPEELAISAEQIRAGQGVFDLSYQLRYGKKGRPQFALQVLTDPDQVEAIAQLCFRETSTLGVRIGETARRILARESSLVSLDDDSIDAQWPVKTVQRPDGTRTAKVEADALSVVPGLARRRAIATDAERLATQSDASNAGQDQ